MGEDGCFWTVGKAMLLGGNSYVITLQKLCYYIAKAMLLRYNNYDFIIQKKSSIFSGEYGGFIFISI